MQMGWVKIVYKKVINGGFVEFKEIVVSSVLSFVFVLKKRGWFWKILKEEVFVFVVEELKVEVVSNDIFQLFVMDLGKKCSCIMNGDDFLVDKVDEINRDELIKLVIIRCQGSWRKSEFRWVVGVFMDSN